MSLKGEFVIHGSQEEEATPRHPTQGHTGEHRLSREAGGWRETCGEEPFLWFPWEGTGEAGEAGLGLASLSNSRL